MTERVTAATTRPGDLPCFARDRTKLSVEAWPGPDGAPLVLVLHGLVSHAGWYRTLCSDLAAAGFGVAIVDRRGAGRSDGPRGHVDRWRTLVDDAISVAAALRERHGARPLHWLGISLGGVIATAVAIEAPELVRSAILMAPGFASRYRLPLARRLAILGSSLLRPRRQCDLPPTGGRLTEILMWEDAIARDPLCMRHATARFLIELVRLQRFTHAHRRALQAPIYALLGAEDEVVDNDATLRLLTDGPQGPVRVETFECAGHVLPASLPREDLVARLVGWIGDVEAQRLRGAVTRVEAVECTDAMRLPPPAWGVG